MNGPDESKSKDISHAIPNTESARQVLREEQNRLAAATEAALQAISPDTVEAFDKLFRHKIMEPALRLNDETQRTRKQVVEKSKSHNPWPVDELLFLPSVTALTELISSDVIIFRTFLLEAEGVAYETWRLLGNSLTPEFVRGLLSHKLCGYIKERLKLIREWMKDCWIKGWSDYISADEMRLVFQHLEGNYGRDGREIFSLQHRYEGKAVEIEIEHVDLPSSSTTTEKNAPHPVLETASQKSGERRKAVEAYIAEVFQKTGKKITRADIWRTARYRTRTEFERWVRNDQKRPNRSAHGRFTKILSEKPHLK